MNSVVRGQKLPLFSVPQLNGTGKVGQSASFPSGFTMVLQCGKSQYVEFTMLLQWFYLDFTIFIYYGFTMVLYTVN